MLEEIQVGGKRFIGLRSGINNMGGTVDWDNDEKQATIDLNGQQTTVVMADENAHVNGRVITLSAAPMVHDGKLYVPEDFFASVMAAQVPI